MPLAVGSRVGTFEITGSLGAGGMGEVYLARDTALGRDVAIKVLPELFARDRERLARFQREAQVLASLNHPNIAHIHGIIDDVPGPGGPAAGRPAHTGPALVLEMVPGPTLAALMSGDLAGRDLSGAPHRMAIPEALQIARQIADALEAAHERGIIHRDLKPANVKVTPEGVVKVLDFGLAKALTGEPASGRLQDSPTITSQGTLAGVILGTAAYMSPEQARGKVVDRRTDVWAFGCVLFEMLSGRPAFDGDHPSDVLARILERNPDFALLPEATPPAIRRLLRRCLEKDRRRRLSDLGDARIEIEDALAHPDASEPPPPRRSGLSALWRWGIPATLALGALLLVTMVSPKPAGRPARFTITPPTSEPLLLDSIGTSMAISPDGSRIVYPVMRGSTVQLYSRRIDQLEARPIPGAEGGRQPFFSPDGQWVGFWAPAEGELRKIPVEGGAPKTICRPATGNLYGAAWGSDFVVFGAGGLYRVSEDGGTPEAIALPSTGRGEVEYRWPSVLPDSSAVVFTIWPGRIDQARIAVHSLRDATTAIILDDASTAQYVDTGHLVFNHLGTLYAAPFDGRNLTTRGPRVPIQENVNVAVTGAAHFAVSRDGTFVHVPGESTPERRLVWVDRAGRRTPLLEGADAYWLPRLSPDGRRLAVGIASDVWVIELDRGTRTRVTFGTTNTLFPYAWSHDGASILFSKLEAKIGLDIHRAFADGRGQFELLRTGEHRQWATSASPDGSAVATYEQHPITLRDIWIVSRDGSRAPFLTGRFQERAARFSPDGRWIAYVSNESGRDEVYLRPYPGPGEQVTVSTEGGTEPIWSATGNEIFYRTSDQLMAASVETVPTLRIGRPAAILADRHVRDPGSGAANANYDVSRDGSRFVMIETPSASAPIVVVLNWLQELSARVQARP